MPALLALWHSCARMVQDPLGVAYCLFVTSNLWLMQLNKAELEMDRHRLRRLTERMQAMRTATVEGRR